MRNGSKMKGVINNVLSTLQQNLLSVFFSFFFSFFLLCSYIYSHANGFLSLFRLLGGIFIALMMTPFMSLLFIKLFSIRLTITSNKASLWNALYNKSFFYLAVIFLFQIPVFLAFYPGMYTYDVAVQIIQYDTPLFILNHPLLHTLFIGFFKNLFSTPNQGYACASLIQMFLLDYAVAYALQFMFKKTNSYWLCTITVLFYAFMPFNSIMAISSTKDVLFSAFTLVFFIDCFRLLQNDLNLRQSLRSIANTVLMLLLRNNAIYAYIPAMMFLLLLLFKQRELLKRASIYFLCTVCLFLTISKALTFGLHAYPGSIKEMMSIPAQIAARVYIHTDDEKIKETISNYIPNPERYCFYLSDAVKEQFDFDTLDSACKHFLLYTAIYGLQNPVTSIDAILYNTQGYWDIFHCPYQADHAFLASNTYRGEASLDSKLPALNEFFMENFHTSQALEHHLWSFIFNPGFYVWICLFFFVQNIQRKNKALYCAFLFPLFYLLTLLLGPGAILRYAYPLILIAPVLCGISLFSSPPRNP